MERNIRNYAALLMQRPHAYAELKGSSVYPDIHGKPDDFTTQPSGNAGEKLACGVIGVCKKQCR